MYLDPTNEVRDAIQAKGHLHRGVQDILSHLRSSGATEDEASDALQTYVLAQMYSDLRKQNPLRAAYEEACAAENIFWYRLLYDLGWETDGSPEDIPC